MKTTVFILLTFWVVFINTTCVYAQNKTLDSLKRQIEHALSDSLKINSMLALSDYYYEQNQDLDSMVFIAREAAKLSKSNGFKLKLCQAYEHLGSGYLFKNELDSAFYFSNESYQISKQLRNVKQEFSALKGLSQYFLETNNLVKATELGLDALKIAEQSYDKNNMALAYYNLSRIFMVHDDDLKYKYYLDKAFEIIEDDKNDIASTTKSGIYTFMVDYFEHQRFYNPENSTLKDSVRFYSEKGITFGKSINDPEILAYLLGIKGKMYFIENNYEEAKLYYNEALTYRNQISKNTLYNLYNKFAYVYIIENKTELALNYKDSILQNISNEPNHYQRGDRFNSAYFICKTLKKYELALEYHEKMTKAFNKAKEESQIAALNELEIQYKTEKKEAEIIAQKLENETLKNKARANYFAISFLGLLGIGVFSVMYFRKKNKVLSTELKLTKTKAALHRSQINPHFISNSINAIYPFLYNKSDPNKAAAYLSDLSQMIRSILDSTFDTSWAVKEEIEFIKQYCNIQELKMDIPFQLNLTCDSNLNKVIIPSLITQPFIENCFVHGFTNKNEPAQIDLRISEHKFGIQIEILDNGVISEHSKSKHQSRSNQIAKERIKNMYGRYLLQKDFLTYGFKSGTYQVIIKLPIQ